MKCLNKASKCNIIISESLQMTHSKTDTTNIDPPTPAAVELLDWLYCSDCSCYEY